MKTNSLLIVMVALLVAACGRQQTLEVTVSPEVVHEDYLGNGVEWDPYDEAESWGWELDASGTLKKGECIYYDEEESPYEAKYYITYSTQADFSSYSILNFNVYARCIIGERYFDSYNKAQFIRGIQKYLPDFWDIPPTEVALANVSTAPPIPKTLAMPPRLSPAPEPLPAVMLIWFVSK